MNYLTEPNSSLIKEQGLVKLKNFPKASQFVNAALAQKHRVICYGGSIRSGKTFNAIASLIILHRLYPGSRSIIVRENLDILRKNTLPSCEKAIPSNFVKQFKGDPQFEWTFKNKSRMFFFAEGYEKDKNYDRWNGLEVNFILLEQVEELQVMALEKSLERVGSYVIPQGKQPEPLLLMTVNPTKTWAKEMIYDKWKNNTLPSKWLYIPALLTDNPFIPDSFKESLQELKRISPVKYQRYVEGDWEVQDVVEGGFYKQFSHENNVTQISYDDKIPLHISFDFNVNPYMSIGICQIEGKILGQIDEIAGRSPDNTTRAVCREFIRKYRSHSAGLFIYGDPSGKHKDTRSEEGHNDFDIIRQELKQYKPIFRVASSHPSVVMRGQFINTIFEQGFDGVEYFIDEGCNLTIKDFTYILEDADGTKKKKKSTDPKTKVSYEELGHFSDLMDYLICEAFKHEFRKYQRGTSVTDYTIATKMTKAY